MRSFLKTVCAEMKKQHKNYFHSRTIYVSLFFWPLLDFISRYYSFKSFDLDKSEVSFLNAGNIVVYLMLGFMCMSFFRSLVQSAWMFSLERQSGTLELIYLSPASRLAVLLGNAVSSLFEGVSLMLVFGGLVLIYCKDALRALLLPCATVILITTAMAVLWGMFLNAMFLYSRDSRILFTIFEEPMEIFSGVITPTSLFPAWAKALSFIFPLTYALAAVRSVFMDGATINDIRGFIFAGICIILLLYLLTAAAIRIAERHSRRTGNFSLF